MVFFSFQVGFVLMSSSLGALFRLAGEALSTRRARFETMAATRADAPVQSTLRGARGAGLNTSMNAVKSSCSCTAGNYRPYCVVPFWNSSRELKLP